MSPAGVSMDEVTFTEKTATSIEGTVTGTAIGMDGIVTPYSWKISLRRNGS
jgi:hypothetical protein